MSPKSSARTRYGSPTAGRGASTWTPISVARRTRAMLLGLSDDDLDRIVDRAWDPPVTLGVRLVSVVNDDTQHVGQAAYVRGLLEMR